MFTQSIFCLVASRGRADRIIHDFKGAEFSSTDIGTLFFDRRSDVERDLAGLSAAATQSAGPIRGALTWIAGVGQLVLPGVGSFIAAGPIIAALLQARTIAPGLRRLGFTEKMAAHYERQIKREAWIVLSVHTINPDTILRARAIFTESGAHDIVTLAEPATPLLLQVCAGISPIPAA